MVVACLSRTAGCAAYGQSVNVIFYLGESAAGPNRPFAAINRRASRHPPIDARGGSRCCRSCRSQTPRAGTDMTAQIEAVDFFAFDNSYARLPDQFFARLPPTPVAGPRLVRLNKKLAWHLRLDPGKLAAPEGVEILAGNRVPKRGEPLAMAYAGHQFGTFVPQLGDGRAILLGEVIDRDGMRRDIQLKGSGPTPFSRRGDGRAALGPVLREYIVSEAMAALGIPTTRALAAVTTGEPVWREKPLPGAVLTRVASSHIRVGTFQFFAACGDLDAVRRLADHVIARHYPESPSGTSPVWRRRSYRCFQRTRTLQSKRRKRQSTRSPPASRRPMPRASAASSACSKRGRTICLWQKTSWSAWLVTAPILP